MVIITVEGPAPPRRRQQCPLKFVRGHRRRRRAGTFSFASACGLLAPPLSLGRSRHSKRVMTAKRVDPSCLKDCREVERLLPYQRSVQAALFRSLPITRRSLKGGVIIVALAPRRGGKRQEGISQTEISKWTGAELPKRPSRISSGERDVCCDGPGNAFCH